MAGRSTTLSPGNVIIANLNGRATTVRVESFKPSGRIAFTHLLTGERHTGRVQMNRAAKRSAALMNPARS